jgi:hypothetical protein
LSIALVAGSAPVSEKRIGLNRGPPELWALDAAHQRSHGATCWPEGAAWPAAMAGWGVAWLKTMAGEWLEPALAALKHRRTAHQTAGSVRSAMQGGLVGPGRGVTLRSQGMV